MNNLPVLEVDDLTVHFPTGRRGETVKAVDGVSFAVAARRDVRDHRRIRVGQVHAGAGAGVPDRVPQGGRLLHRGQDPYAMSRAALRMHRRGFQIVFQDPNAALDPRMTIGASIREPLDIAAEGSMAQRMARIRHLLDCVGLRAETEARYPHELSVWAEAAGVNIARALALQPAVMVCDEVVAALDASIQADVLNLFADLQQEFDLTYVFITHDLGVVSHVSDRIAVMYLGRLMELGPAEQVTGAPLHPYTQALLSSEPEPLPTGLRTARRIHLQGEIPSPIDPPSGCRFRTRCPIATERCGQETPAWRALRPGHLVACHYAELLPEAGAQARAALPQEQGN